MILRRLKYSLIIFLRLKGASGKLALGFALGACVNFYPTFGAGIPIAALVAGVMFASIPASLLGDIIFKPLFPLFFYLNLVTGNFFWPKDEMSVRLFRHVINHMDIASFGTLSKVFFTGAIINSLILGSILYVIVYLMISRFRLPLLKMIVNTNRGKR